MNSVVAVVSVDMQSHTISAGRLGTTTPEVVAAAVVENMAVLDNRERPIRAMIDYHVVRLPVL